MIRRTPAQARRRLSRRALLGAAGVGAAVAGAAGAGVLAGRASAASTTIGLDKPVPFRGQRQAGIVTPAQDRMHFCAFDLTTESKADVVTMLKEWTAMAERMTAGQEAARDGAVGSNPYAPPSDTGEALGLPASQLTLTIGFGPGFFVKDGKDRFGIADQTSRTSWPICRSSPTRPSTLPGVAATSSCKPAPTTRRSRSTRSATWPGSGSAPWPCATPNSASAAPPRPPASSPPRETCSASRTEPTTSRPRTPAPLDEHVWVADGDGPAWLTGGTYLVARRIRMRIETWDRTTLLEQERVIGRHKGSGAPLGFADEFTALDFEVDRRRRRAR